MSTRSKRKPTRPRSFVVKVQRAIISTVGAPILVYNKDRSVLVQQQSDAEFEGMFKPGEYKLYARAELQKNGVVAIGARVADQPW